MSDEWYTIGSLDLSQMRYGFSMSGDGSHVLVMDDNTFGLQEDGTFVLASFTYMDIRSWLSKYRREHINRRRRRRERRSVTKR